MPDSVLFPPEPTPSEAEAQAPQPASEPVVPEGPSPQQLAEMPLVHGPGGAPDTGRRTTTAEGRSGERVERATHRGRGQLA